MNIDLSTYVQFFSDSDRYPLSGKDECTLKKKYARTNTFKFSFFNRIVDMWNTLPLLVRQATTIASFKEPPPLTCLTRVRFSNEQFLTQCELNS